MEVWVAVVHSLIAGLSAVAVALIQRNSRQIKNQDGKIAEIHALVNGKDET